MTSLIEAPAAPAAGVLASIVLFAMGFSGYGLLALLGGYVTYAIANRTTGE